MGTLVKIIAEDAQKIIDRISLDEIVGKTIVITGASGLIGTYLLATLHSFLTSQSKQTNIYALVQSDVSEHTRYFLNYAGAKILQGDLTDQNFLAKLPKADYIIHAAGYGQPGKFMENQIKTIELNTTATLALFEKLLPGGKFLFMSTSEVYSGLRNPPFNEQQIGTTNTTHPRSCYIEGKRCGETIVNAFRAKGVDAKSARLSLAYGPGTKSGDKRVINNFIYKALQGKIDLLDQGEAKRTYCYVADAVEILWHILLSGKEPIYNVGGESKTTIAELAKSVGTIVGAPVTFPNNSDNTVAGAPDDVFLDMSLVQREFGKKDFLPLDIGLKKTIEWQRALCR
ncbi:MAG: hypothetical protein A3I29_04165 [Candidatus Magasanikbacteria bacterium RIFCSPLOWO2_02_FULL_44_11]|uniref:NAD-dependent epimerase/dehydratase domain-containing protein n=2 Tax=Candidatus Magasanikiibacteriota TaxID=1752731 RepID=A0A1F6N9Z7_9BACT|nr:MAG: hypothetical protein A3D53_02820 [Candidatus Magasanikbacteria bacterium RIFCSPHIGHO2_02_FULL_45_10]OGH80608.1 MAG: hypothetical protein A3I29_04165 [Candidatus Magasanikbacteria bacterium RIFCSPLOWO2_02_FULL_44_11]